MAPVSADSIPWGLWTGQRSYPGQCCTITVSVPKNIPDGGHVNTSVCYCSSPYLRGVSHSRSKQGVLKTNRLSVVVGHTPLLCHWRPASLSCNLEKCCSRCDAQKKFLFSFPLFFFFFLFKFSAVSIKWRLKNLPTRRLWWPPTDFGFFHTGSLHMLWRACPETWTTVWAVYLLPMIDGK